MMVDCDLSGHHHVLSGSRELNIKTTPTAVTYRLRIGVARGALGACVPPWQRKKIFGRGANLQGQIVSAPPRQIVHPEGEQEFIFEEIGEILAVGEVI